jgi:hypothetical protein
MPSVTPCSFHASRDARCHGGTADVKHSTGSVGMFACGRLRTFTSASCATLARGPRAVSRRGLAVAALACGEGTLCCSLREGGCDDSASALNGPLHRAFSPTRRGTAGQTLSALRCSPAPMRPVGTPPSGPSSGGALRAHEHTLTLLARLRVGGLGSEWAAPSSAGLRGLPAAQRWDGEDCRAPLPAQRASQRGGSLTSRSEVMRTPKGRVPQPPSQTEQRRGVGAQRRPPTAERTSPPARSLARADGCADVRNGPFADLRSVPRCIHHRSREARWSH